MYFNIANQLPVFTMGMCTFFLVKADTWPVRSKGARAIGFVLFTGATEDATLALDTQNGHLHA